MSIKGELVDTGLVTSVLEQEGVPADQATLPATLLSQNYPNPFNAVTTVQFALPEACEVTLEIFNVIGQKVVTLVGEKLSAGHYNVNWDSRDGNGTPVASGVYLYRLKAGGNIATRKMLLLK